MYEHWWTIGHKGLIDNTRGIFGFPEDGDETIWAELSDDPAFSRRQVLQTRRLDPHEVVSEAELLLQG